jgi:hypothetical protein
MTVRNYRNQAIHLRGGVPARAVGLWALGAQSLPDPWNKLCAISSPGFGYAIGVLFEVLIERVSESRYKNRKRRSLLENKETIDKLYKERQDAIEYGADPKLISSIDAAILEIQQTSIDVIVQPYGKERARRR